jgi:hypothetical protein
LRAERGHGGEAGKAGAVVWSDGIGAGKDTPKTPKPLSYPSPPLFLISSLASAIPFDMATKPGQHH